MDGRARDTRIRVDDLTREQKRADADVEQVKTRQSRDQDRVDRGAVTNPKDLENLQHELVSLQRRISDLEDTELEVMQRLEDAQAELDAATAELADVDSRIAATTAERDDKLAALDADLAQVARQRAEAAEGMPEDLMGLYQRLREQKQGVGAAALRARRCEGCMLELNAADRAEIARAAADEVVRCEECSRILVRTSESGV